MIAPRTLVIWTVALVAAVALTVGCGRPVEEPEPEPEINPAQAAFMDHLAALCGQAFPGHTEFVAEEDSPFADATLAMAVAECSEGEIRIPFHVNDDTWSRTWVLTLDERGLLLKHDHRHQDGTPEEDTNYGGWATEDGLPSRQVFPADYETAEMFPEAATNIWTLELNQETQAFNYILTRHGAPRFRATFDLTQGRPIAPENNDN